MPVNVKRFERLYWPIVYMLSLVFLYTLLVRELCYYLILCIKLLRFSIQKMLQNQAGPELKSYNINYKISFRLWIVGFHLLPDSGAALRVDLVNDVKGGGRKRWKCHRSQRVSSSNTKEKLGGCIDKTNKNNWGTPSIFSSLTLQILTGAQQEAHHGCHAQRRCAHRSGSVAVIRIAGADHLPTTKTGTLIAIVGGGLILIGTGPNHTAIRGHCNAIVVINQANHSHDYMVLLFYLRLFTENSMICVILRQYVGIPLPRDEYCSSQSFSRLSGGMSSAQLASLWLLQTKHLMAYPETMINWNNISQYLRFIYIRKCVYPFYFPS